MSTLVIVEHDNKTMHSATRHAFTAATELDKQASLLVIGYQCREVAEQAAQLAGAHKVLLVDDIHYKNQLAENVSELVVTLADDYSAIIAAASTFGKNVLPRIAAKLDVGQISDVSKIIEPTVFEHPIYAGNAIETVKVLDDKTILTIRTTAFAPCLSAQTSCTIHCLDKVIANENTSFVSHELTTSARPDLGNAKIIISGGRGLQNMENFKLIEELADLMGAAVGASRAAVDAGFVPNEYQVGQTGRVVAPDLYIAIGISGAIQHLAGMKDSKIIVAINKDADAPIFQVANYGLVGDLFQIVPQLIEELTNH